MDPKGTGMEVRWIALMVMAAAVCVGTRVYGQDGPAARRHVKYVGTTAFKFTSRLSRVVELNFTMGYGHPEGKPLISDALGRIARVHATAGKDAFTVRRIVGPGNGTTGGVPNFTVDDLLGGQVIVANNVSAFGSSTLGAIKQQAIQRAIETEGRGYLAFHGSGDNERNDWPWFTSQLHPTNYQGHGKRTVGPVYRHLAESSHVVLQGVLASRTVLSTVPDEVQGGIEKLVRVPARGMMNEWYRFGRDITADPAYSSRATVLLKYDARDLGTEAIPPEFIRKGGNLYTYLLKVGAGMTSFLPAGHADDELMHPGTGFDGGAGDLDRYLGQLLFFLAGYASTPCDASCDGLPIADVRNRLTGDIYRHTPIGTRAFPAGGPRLDAAVPAFAYSGRDRYEAVLQDLEGRVLSRAAGSGPVRHVFDRSRLGRGICVLSARFGGSAPLYRRYAVAR